MERSEGAGEEGVRGGKTKNKTKKAVLAPREGWGGEKVEKAIERQTQGEMQPVWVADRCRDEA